MNWRTVVISVKLFVLGAVYSFAGAQDTLSDQALLFSSTIEEHAYSVSETDWLEHEASLELLPVTIRLQRYQDLSFKYLVEMKSDEFGRLREKYQDDLQKFGNEDHRVTQEILEAFSLRAEFGDYHAAIARLNDLLRSGTLSESQRERASAALAYALTDAGMPEEAEEVMGQPKPSDRSSESSPLSEIERQDALAYANLHLGDYHAALHALRMSARRQAEIEIPFDSSYMLSSTIWLLQESGAGQAASEVSQKLNAARDRSLSMADSTPNSGAAGAPPALRQRSNSSDSETQEKRDDRSENMSGDVPWQGMAWFVLIVIALIAASWAFDRFRPPVEPAPKKVKNQRVREVDQEAFEVKPSDPDPAPETDPKPKIPDVPIKLKTVDNAAEGLLSDLRVLVVDDNETNIEVLVGFLEIYGLKNYYIARNGEEAWSIALRAPTDLIFMDIQMPVLNGIDATKRIREHKRGASIPIVGVTAFSRVVNEEMCLAAGMNDFITKPVEMDKLHSSLKKVVTRNPLA